MKPKREPAGRNQQSVWDYPRPPRLERTAKRIKIVLNGVEIADTDRAWRVLETSHAPVYYIPPEDLRAEYMTRERRPSFCEWKGMARYLSVRVGDRSAECAGWYYPDPTPAFEPIRHHVAFYAGPFDRCTVDGEVVRPQPGGFYGGWITSDLVGPFKGEPGTGFW